MRIHSFTKLFTILGLSLSFFAIDRKIKLLMESNLSNGDIFVFGDWFRFSLHYNEHLALSIPFPLFAQIALSFILLGILIWYFWKRKVYGVWEILSISLIFGGAFGNLSDRIVLERVIDFIALWNFPVFNMADVFLFLGVCFFLVQELISQKK